MVKLGCWSTGKLAALDAEIVADHVRQAVGMCSRYCGLFYSRCCRALSGESCSTHNSRILFWKILSRQRNASSLCLHYRG